MRSALALIRVAFLTAASYRLAMFISVASLAWQIVPTYYIGHALDPFMAPIIKGQGADYFGFLVVGTMAYLLLAAAVDSLPRALERGIATGTLELIFSTPSPVPALLVGLTGYEILFATTRAIVVLSTAAAFGFNVHWAGVPAAGAILFLIVATYFGIGMIAGASIIAYRRTASIQTIAIVGSAMLGGVSYPPSLVPVWIRGVSAFVPMTYGLRAVRRMVIDGRSVSFVLADVGILAIFCFVFLAAGSVAMTHALKRARAEGTLSQY